MSIPPSLCSPPAGHPALHSGDPGVERLHTHRRLAAILLVGLALVLAACGTTSGRPAASTGAFTSTFGSPSASASFSAPAASGSAVSASGSAPSPLPSPEPSSDPLEPSPSPSLPALEGPGVQTPGPAAAGLVLHVPVLMYHRVIPPSKAGDSLPGLVVPPALFAAQMNVLARAGWHTITAARLLDDLAAGIRPTPKTFVITLDDGYDDGYTYALPVLRSHRFVATFYVIAERIGNAPGPFEALTPEHVRALAAAGMEIGNHTYDHVDLSTASAATIRYEVLAASSRIQSLVGVAPTTLAYPFGAWGFEAAAEIKAAGIGIAFTTVEGAREAWPTRYASPRVRVSPSTTPQELLTLVERYSA